MKVKFKGAPGEDLKSITMYGLEFGTGKSVDVSSLPRSQQRKLANHPHFEASGKDVEDVQYQETKNDSQRDGAAQLANRQAEFDIATAELQGKAPAPNAKEGLVPDVADGPVMEPVQKDEPKPEPKQTEVVKEKPAAREIAKSEPTREELEVLAAAVGIKVDDRWSDATLKKKVDEKADQK
jgi:hypothetical protein